MRWALAALVLGLAACDADVRAPVDGEQAAAGGYTIEIRATDVEQTYLITAPDGRTIGARAAEGASALMDTTRAQALAADPLPQSEETMEVLSLRVPGFDLSIGANEENAEGEHGQVRLSLGGTDGQRVEVNANEGGPGDADDRAHVRITGADEAAVREFITGQDELSPSVQAQMLAELGVSEEAR